MSDPVKPLILIVDDVPTNIKMLGKSLQDEYDVVAATSGEDCLRQVVREPRPDLILLDVMMPGMDGFEVCRQIKADERSADIPVIFLTSMDDQVNEEEGLKAGAVDYITKPFRLAIVKARINIHLELQQHRAFLERALSKRTRNLKLAQGELLQMIRGRGGRR
ncbi:MAG: response regulator [Gammaproteobacteria bacterium]|nr:response regulator [Gammaproteobacteria bacterium]